MRRALMLAARARGRTFPNPLVGALIVKGGRVIGQGYHQKAGGPHAEILALRQARARAKGATLFSTFEPCVHHGRTGPCAEALIGAGISEVYIGIRDPNPLTRGRGIRVLQKAGITVHVGFLQQEIRGLNDFFFCAMERQRPLITVKMAQSIDGKTATGAGRSQWITSVASRRHAHRLRRNHDAIMVGIRTVLKDNPRLEPAGRHVLAKIILDSDLRIPVAARLFKTVQPLIVACVAANKRKEAILKTKGVEIIRTRSDNGRVDLSELVSALGKREIRHVLVEGGASLVGAFLDKKLADRAVFYIAPMILGGHHALGAGGGKGVVTPQKGIRLKDWSIEKIGPDLHVQGRLDYSSRLRRRSRVLTRGGM